MKRLVVLGVLIGFCSILLAKEYIIDDYSFDWIVANHGDASLIIQKEPDRMRVILRKKTGISLEQLCLTPLEAKEIGSVLAKANDYYDKQKESSSDVKDEENAGDYKVIFMTSMKYGFSVLILESARFSMSRFSLDRKEANGLSEDLADITEKANFLDNSIHF